MDQELLDALKQTLNLLFEATEGLEGHVALLRVCTATLRRLHRHPALQAARKPAQPPAELGMQWPAEFERLQQSFASLSQPSAGQGVTQTAAAGFLQSLEGAYGPGSQQQAVGAGSTPVRWLKPNAFADQACFIGLVAAVLSAVQVRAPA